MSILGNSLIGFIIAIIILVAIHEFGHFYVARRCGVKVLEFAIGFGKPIWQFYRKNDPTQYSLRLIPLGGYVKMLDEREAPVPIEQKHLAFNHKSSAAKAAIVFAGPFANFVFALFAMWIVFMVGQQDASNIIGNIKQDSLAAQYGFSDGDRIIAVDGRENRTFSQNQLYLTHQAMNQASVEFTLATDGGKLKKVDVDLSQLDDFTRAPVLLQLGIFAQPPLAKIGKVVPQMPADQAGLQAGDEVIAVDNQPITDWGDLVRYISARPNQEIAMQVLRDGDANRQETILINTKAITRGEQTFGQIGVMPTLPDMRLRYGPVQAIWASVDYFYRMLVVNVRGIWMMLTGQMSLKNISGPITIAQYAGVTVETGVMDFIRFLAIISLSLGIINLLPIPVLDGGHLMYIGYEAATGRPPSEKFMLAAQQIGLFLILMLMTLAIFNDVTRLFGIN